MKKTVFLLITISGIIFNSYSQNNSVVHKNNINKRPASNVKKEIMTLISGASQDCTTIIFKNSKGKEIHAGEIPDFIKWHGEEQSEIDETFCNKKYLITYTMKKYYCESSGDNRGSLEMNVSKMENVE